MQWENLAKNRSSWTAPRLFQSYW